ncbi:hypothetical protein F4778DRAFT_778139 [Xylariomycetidae sp. FL2044]|nr:hypothetical protein F4778DRAFT_778139 [Xylariomycetidae sp. FL2044]
MKLRPSIIYFPFFIFLFVDTCKSCSSVHNEPRWDSDGKSTSGTLTSTRTILGRTEPTCPLNAPKSLRVIPRDRQLVSRTAYQDVDDLTDELAHVRNMLSNATNQAIDFMMDIVLSVQSMSIKLAMLETESATPEPTSSSSATVQIPSFQSSTTSKASLTTSFFASAPYANGTQPVYNYTTDKVNTSYASPWWMTPTTTVKVIPITGAVNGSLSTSSFTTTLTFIPSNLVESTTTAESLISRSSLPHAISISPSTTYLEDSQMDMDSTSTTLLTSTITITVTVPRASRNSSRLTSTRTSSAIYVPAPSTIIAETPSVSVETGTDFAALDPANTARLASTRVSSDSIESASLEYDVQFKPQLDAPRFDTPELDTIELDTPELDTIELDTPKFDALELNTPELDSFRSNVFHSSGSVIRKVSCYVHFCIPQLNMEYHDCHFVTISRSTN